MAQTSLPPGFLFRPTDVELVSYYLKRKIMGKKLVIDAISEVDLYEFPPWDLPDKSSLRSKDLEWFFFCPCDKKYPNGSRKNRATPNGYWKLSGIDRTIMLDSRIVGMKKTLIFHKGRPPNGDRTDWVMFEYKMEDEDLVSAGFSKDALVLCKIFKKSGLGPRIGEQYGAPFNEAEWDNAEAETSMCPLMTSSEVANPTEVPHTQHAVPAASRKPPLQNASAACAGEESLFDHASATACVEDLTFGYTVAPLRDTTLGEGMMEAPTTSSLGAMGPLLRKLSLLLAPEYPLRRSVKHALELLKEDVEEIDAVLVELSMEDSACNKAKYWMHEVRELSYDMEDCIDGMMQSHTAAGANGRSISDHMDRLSTARHKIARFRNTGFKIPQFSSKLKPSSGIARIAELRTLLREASERYEKYQLDGCTSSNPRFPFIGRSIKVPAKYNIAANIVGMEGSRDKLRKWLTDKEKHQLQVLAIIGPPGVRKTTFVRELYRELKGQFECRAFIRMTRKQDMSILLGEILSQLQRPKQSSIDAFSSVQNIIDNIRDHLQDKRYLIVIDHLWEAESWDIVHNAFPKGNNCSRIIITADVNIVPAQFCGHHSVNVFELQPLSIYYSEKLFINRIFGSEDICPDQLKGLCRGILRKCGGLPLATIAIAGLLACQPDNKDLWRHVMKCLSSNLSNLTLEELQKEIVKLCYNSLPQDLKTCLLYFTTYPEGYTIRKIDLIKQWIAEGFISPTEEKELVAESYFDELVNRGMIQPEQINRNNEVLSCSVHHIILDLIMSKCREDNFITEVDYSKTVTWFSRRARRLFLHLSCAQYATKPEGIRLSQVRSLAFFGLLRCMPSVMEFKVLRVLILELWGGYDDCLSLDLSKIFSLFLLRYLKISSHICVELPSQIRGLKFLETVEINARVLNIPNDIVHLPCLLHLSVQDETKLPDRIGSITSLETLEYFDLGKNTEDNVRSLGELINLRDLHLTCSTALSQEHLKRNLEALASSLRSLASLKSLTLAPSAVGMTMFIDHSRAIFSTPIFLQKLELSPPICIFYRLPEWIEKFQRLRILKIVVRVLLRSDIDILTGLSDLSFLSLYIRQPNAETVIFNNGSLPVLKYLKYTCGAFCIAFQEEALASLQKMKLCFNIRRGGLYSHMVSGIEHLLNLNEIAVKVGAASDVEESDRRAAESVFERTLRKHPRFPIDMNVRRVDWIEEE